MPTIRPHRAISRADGLALAERVVAQLPADTLRVDLDVDATDYPCHASTDWPIISWGAYPNGATEG